jgi:multisubunit Na+/H+ antiporter MnhF subunit
MAEVRRRDMLADLLQFVLYASLVIHIVMITVCVWRVWRGENVIDRLIGVDLLSTLTIAVLVLLSLLTQDAIYIDVALALGALSFISTVALAKFTAEQQMF